MPLFPVVVMELIFFLFLSSAHLELHTYVHTMLVVIFKQQPTRAESETSFQTPLIDNNLFYLQNTRSGLSLSPSVSLKRIPIRIKLASPLLEDDTISVPSTFYYGKLVLLLFFVAPLPPSPPPSPIIHRRHRNRNGNVTWCWASYCVPANCSLSMTMMTG